MSTRSKTLKKKEQEEQLKNSNKKQKSLSKNRSASKKSVKNDLKETTFSKTRSTKSLFNKLEESKIFQEKTKNKIDPKKKLENKMIQETQKRETNVVRTRFFRQQKTKKTEESISSIINLDKQFLENVNQKGKQKKEQIIQEIESKKMKLREPIKSDGKKGDALKKQQYIEISDNSDLQNEKDVSIQIDISVEQNDSEYGGEQSNSISDKQQQNGVKQQRKNKRTQSKDHLKMKRTKSSSNQKFQSEEKKEQKSPVVFSRITRSSGKDSQQNEQQNVIININGKKDKRKNEEPDKASKKENKNDQDEKSQEKLQNKEVPQNKRGRKPKQVQQNENQIEKQIVIVINEETIPKKRGRPTNEEISRRDKAEHEKQKKYVEEQSKKVSVKDVKEQQNKEQVNEPLRNQALIVSQKPAKKEKRIEDEKYQKLHTSKIEKNVYDQAIEMLQEYSLPDEIPCREEEKKQILEFINEGLSNNGSSNCLYISGIPGIGKTASFLEVIKKLQNEKKNEFTFIHINAMNLSNPENLYYILVKQITGQNCTTKQKACSILNEIFTNGKLSKRYESYGTNLDNKNKVILLDELDYLVTQDQELLYNLMEWPHQKFSKLTIIGIANTMNLPETLMNKIKSRMGSRRLVFEQYNHKQIQEIITTRLEKEEKVREVFETSAIQFACKKVAINSSDIRKTLKVLRKSVEICQLDNMNDPSVTKVSIPMIQQSYNQLYSSPILKSIQKLQFHHKLMVISIALENRHRGIPIAYLSESYNRYRIMLSNLGKNETINFNQMKMILNQLSVMNLIQQKEKEIVKDTQLVGIDPNKKHYCHVVDIQIISNFTVDELTNSLKDDEIYLKFQFQF